MKTICTETTSGAPCKTVDGDLSENLYCLSGENKIYKSTSSDCEAINTEAVVSIFEKKADGYALGTFGSINEGIIYSCAANGSCEQLVDTYYYSTNLYKCDATGKCTKQASASGTYLTGVGVVGPKGVVTYSSAVTCTSGSSCNAVTAGIFVDAATPGNIIKCGSNGSECTSSPGSNAPGVAYVGSATKTIIKCTSSSSCLSATHTSASDLYYIDGSAPNKLIKCDSSKCESNTVSTSAIQPDGTNSDRMLVCTSAGCIATKSKYNYV